MADFLLEAGSSTPAMDLPIGHAGDSLPEIRTAYFNGFLNEFHPVGAAEFLLVRDMARLAAQLIVDEQLIDSTESQLRSLTSSLNSAASLTSDASPATTHLVAPGRLDALSRSSLRTSNAFFLRLSQLRDEQRRHDRSQFNDLGRDSRFATENQCLAWLLRSFRDGRHPCRRCGVAARGSWIALRRAWECGSCRAQTGVRHRTVLADSKLPVATWFHAIRIMLLYPTTPATALAAATGIARRATVRAVMTRIGAAVVADDASEKLAFLDHAYLT